MNFLDQSSSLYLYSALLQANASIIALIGIFFIYKFQAIQSDLNSTKGHLINKDRTSGMVIRYDSFIKQNISGKKKKLIEYASDPLHDDYSEWYKRELEVVQLKTKIKFPIFFLAVILISNSILLLLSSFLHNYYRTLEVVFGVSSLTLEIVIIIVISRLIYFIISDKVFNYKMTLEELANLK